jgi:ATP adenylyltransferase
MSLMFSDLPFAYFSTALPQNPSPRLLHETYTALHDSACRTVQAVAGNLSSASNLRSPIGYNLAFTDRVMVLCPRASDGVEIKNSSGEPIGLVSLNGSLLGGTILTKSEAEFHALRNDESMLRDVLRAIGFPPNKLDHDERL